jgi:hypothetical protein
LNSLPRPAGRVGAVGVVCLLFFLSPLLDAYEVPLSPASLHEAWTLGQRNDQMTAKFLASYVKELAEGVQTNLHTAEVEVLTPFVQVVDESGQHPSGYTEAQAVQDYHQRGDTIVVRVLLMLPATYPRPKDNHSPVTQSQASATELRPENFWQNFHFNVKQHGRLLAPRSIKSKPVYSAATKEAPAVLDGATVWLQYDAKDVALDEIVVEVITPEAETFAATFDLKILR